MTDALLLAVVGVGTDLPRIKSFTNSPLVFGCFLVGNALQIRKVKKNYTNLKVLYRQKSRKHFSASDLNHVLRVAIQFSKLSIEYFYLSLDT